jgi:hypothetical protein
VDQEKRRGETEEEAKKLGVVVWLRRPGTNANTVEV